MLTRRRSQIFATEIKNEVGRVNHRAEEDVSNEEHKGTGEQDVKGDIRGFGTPKILDLRSEEQHDGKHDGKGLPCPRVDEVLSDPIRN